MDSGPESSSVSPRVLLSGESPDEPLPAPSNEDGYLGDCSSDGGNEKNFPMPSEVLISSRLEQPDLSFKGPTWADALYDIPRTGGPKGLPFGEKAP
ncbi:Hypothetical protein FKW44_000096, partial [Caligus rogercresseyi]